MKTIASELGSASALASTLSARLERFLSPLLVRLDQVLDRRLVQTFAAILSILLQQRYRAGGLLLSELGAFLGGFAHAPGGTKRLSNLLRSPRWSATPLWLVVSRRGKGQEPWYLLTNEPAETPRQMWQVVFAYARRWQIEMAFRFTNSELALESPRLWFWDNRLKLLQMVSLAYTFLLSLLDPELKQLRDALLRAFCPRTGKRSREVSTPLYRLRAAICFLYVSLRTPLLPQLQSSG
jgi:hypothetical protein